MIQGGPLEVLKFNLPIHKCLQIFLSQGTSADRIFIIIVINRGMSDCKMEIFNVKEVSYWAHNKQIGFNLNDLLVKVMSSMYLFIWLAGGSIKCGRIIITQTPIISLKISLN